MTCPTCGSSLEPGALTCGRCSSAVRPSGGAGAVLPSVPTPFAGLRSPSQSSPNLKPLREEQPVTAVRVADVLSARYRLEEKIGEGGMGAVFTAHDLELDRKVAVKVLASALVNDAEVVERFEREAKLTAALDHPNIVPIYDVGRHEGRPYIVMKLLQGDTLAGLLRARGGLTSDETVKLLKQLSAGVDYIHLKGFIHRDIKAGNIFVAAGGHATILDFGILRARVQTQGLTRTGMVMGTPHYMAPEQALGLKDVDHRVDLYALAVVLFECLTGTLPFEADSELRLIQMQAHSPPPDILARAPWIPRPVAEVVHRALAKRPEDRFSSGEELVKALEAAYARSSPQGAPGAAHAEPAVAPHTSPSWRTRGEEGPPPVVEGRLTPTQQAGAPKADTGELARAVRPSRAPLLAVLALLALGAAALAFYQPWVARAGPPSLDAALAVAPAATEAGAALAGGPDAGELAEVAPDAGEPLAAGDPDGGVEEDDGDEPRVDPKTTQVVKRPKRKGKVNVITTSRGEPYWAQVSIDGVSRGRTPLALDLPPGKYQVRVERAGFRTQQRQITVASGKAVVLRIDLVP